MKVFKNPVTGETFEDISVAKKAYCTTHPCTLGGCKFYEATNGGLCSKWAAAHPEEAAELMGLVVEEAEVISAPRLAEVLGVKVGQKIRIVGGDFDTVEFCIQEDGEPSTYIHAALPYAINHPESIIHLQRLTEPEIAIMRSLGAKWVSHGDGTRTVRVELWPEKPQKNDFGVFVGTRSIASVNADLFPSVKPGDVIRLEEADKREEGRT